LGKTFTYIYVGGFFMERIVRSFLVVVLIAAIALNIHKFIYWKSVDKQYVETSKSSEYTIFIDIEGKVLFLLKNGEVIKKYPVAVGKENTPSPIGHWKIVSKGAWGGGFGERWLGLNVPWGKYGIHGTNKPGSIGYNASHGCIRMYNKDIKELYDIVPYGTSVIIVNGPFGPFGTGFKTIKIGARGADVYAVQERLKELGYYDGYVDGIYGEDLKKALHKFQKEHGLPVKNDITKKDLIEMGFKEFD